MKSFKNFKTQVTEVAEPKSAEEKKFKDQHKIEVMPHPTAGDEVFKGTKAAKPKAKRKADQEGDANYDMAYESAEQIDEISKKTLGSYVKKASSDMANNAYALGARDPLKKPGSWDKAFKRKAGIEKATNKLTKEEAEQLDELSPNTLHSYIKKAAGNMAGNAAVAAAQASSSMKKSSPDVKRKIKNRMQGITGASGRLADKANMAENWEEEIPMMMRQLEFIAYAAEEIMDYVETAGDPEEWFQNKISGIHSSMLSMYAYAQGGRRAGYGFDESVEEELKGGQKKLDHNKNGKIDAHDFHMMRKKKKNEEVEQIDEVSQKTLWNYHAKAGADLQKKREKLDKGTLTMKDLKKGQNRVKGLNRAADKMHEEVEVLDEAFKQGIVKLKDGSSIVLKKEDANLLNQMFKDLSTANRKKMQEVAMKDKSGFEEILGFAREAL